MNKDNELNKRGNREGSFTQGVGGWAEYTVQMTEIEDIVRHDLRLPPEKIIPIIFLPGVMGSNLRMSKAQQKNLEREDNRSWRPDDMLSFSGGVGVVFGEGFGGWFKNATPAQRQLNFDPDETEVENYNYTENSSGFDPEGKETLGSDARHSNVPDSLPIIPPLLGASPYRAAYNFSARRKVASPAQVARWRGWSEILFSGSYGDILKKLEFLLNNISKGDDLNDLWTTNKSAELPHRKLFSLLLGLPTKFGASSGNALTKEELKRISNCWYPVHAIGYNFLKSNGESAVVVANRIRGLVKGYKNRGFKCDEVIIVTHSMGGLLGRALIHPSYGNLLADKDVKVLGMYHSVMPSAGAAATYKRMRFGFQEKDSWLAETQARLFGVNGKHATAILANTPGPLELLPADAYGSEWLQVQSAIEEPIGSWPNPEFNAFQDIYTKSANSWWRLVNPLWVNPANKRKDQGGGIDNVYQRIKKAFVFLNSIKDCFHPTSCWLSYCASANRLCYGDVVFVVMNFDVYGKELKKLPPPSNWTLLADDSKGRLTVQAGSRKLILQLKRPKSRGDETVPLKRSAKLAKGTHFVHGYSDEGYEHQNSYSDDNVVAAMLYSIVKMANLAKWG